MRLHKDKQGNWQMSVTATERKKLTDAADVLRGIARMEINDTSKGTTTLADAIDAKVAMLEPKEET